METTKYCKGCGLPLMPVYDYVASGGTRALAPPATEELPPSGLTPKQKMVLAILFFVFAPGLFSVLGGPFGRVFVPLFGMLMPLGIVWSVFYFKAQARQLQSQRTPSAPLMSPPTPPVYVPPPQTHAQPLPPHRTNPLDAPPRPVGSVTDDETRRLPDQPVAPPPGR